ncbi:MAG: hypothetical protein N2645_15430 [Clostridia bacterium]|nr:hypothetical protein [Clostridia bacterium]
MKIGLMMLLILSLPEAIINLIMIITVSEKSDVLQLNIKNTIRFVITIALMLTATCILKPLSNTVLLSYLVNIFSYTIIICIMYRINIGILLFCSSVVVLLVSTLENIFIPFVITYVTHGVEAYFNNLPLMFLCSLPIRGLQVYGIYIINKYKAVLIVSRFDKKFRIFFVVCNLIILVTQNVFSKMYIDNFNDTSLLLQILYAACLLAIILTVYIFIYSFMYSIAKGIIKRMDDSYKKLEYKYSELEDNTSIAFSKLHSILKNNNVEEAINVIESILRELPKPK